MSQKDICDYPRNNWPKQYLTFCHYVQLVFDNGDLQGGSESLLIQATMVFPLSHSSVVRIATALYAEASASITGHDGNVVLSGSSQAPMSISAAMIAPLMNYVVVHFPGNVQRLSTLLVHYRITDVCE